MTAWDPRLWRKRALARQGNTQRYVTDHHAINGIDDLVNWCNTQGISIDFTRSSGGCYEPDSRSITISASARPITQLFLLIHEIGHFLYETKHPSRASGPRERRGSTLHAVNTLGEEFEAWRLGSELAEGFDIVLGDDYQRFRAQCLSGYIEWAAVRGEGYTPE